MKLISRLLLASVSLLIACDPGYSYHPDNWQPLEQGHSWKKSLNGIEANIYSMGGLVSHSVVITLKLTNRTSRQLVLEGADLIVRDRQPFSAKLPGSGALRWRTVNPLEGQIKELEQKLEELERTQGPRSEKVKLRTKIKNLKDEASRARKGEEHGRRARGQ